MTDNPNQTTTSLKRRWRTGNHDDRKRCIVDVGIDMLHRKGLQAVTMRAVATRIGVGTMTLYTYIHGQDALRREMIRRGFDILNAGCQQASTLTTPGTDGWLGGARHYLRFAMENPNLYQLMFGSQKVADESDDQLLEYGFGNLIEKVRTRLANSGKSEAQMAHLARIQAGRFWIALHGMASLAIAGRLSILNRTNEELLEDLLTRVAPD